jgi:hypothetical protein
MAAKTLETEYMDEGVIIGIPGEMLKTVSDNIDRIGYVKKRLQ